MAYAAFVSSAPRTVDGRSYIVYTVLETEARDTSEYTLPDVPFIGTVVLVVSKLTAGTGTTVRPEVGNVAAWVDSSVNEVGRIVTAAAFINEGSSLRYQAPLGELYFRSTPDSVATDHSITTVIVVLEGVI